jgi:hypothetical protein
VYTRREGTTGRSEVDRYYCSSYTSKQYMYFFMGDSSQGRPLSMNPKYSWR